jgi:xanthosine utilization system XapX-like protein
MSYHGMAPLLTRLLLDPFVTIGAASLAPVSIWLWATLGSAAWHGALLRVGMAHAAAPGLLAVLGAAIWLGGPGLLLATNHAFYHEPIALAYAAAGAFALVWTGMAERGRVTALALAALATLAALTLHARPNLAIGLYLAAGIAMVQALGRTGRAALPGIAAALAILAASGAGYLALNKAQFGAATTAHGSFAPGDVQYGIAFWDMETPDNPRQQAFEEHGRFNPGRILPNAAMYLAAPPQVLAPEVNRMARDLHEAATIPRTGYGRIEGPGGGVLFLWTVWTLLAGIGLGALRRRGAPYAGLLAGVAAGSLVTLSYATITLRYHVDLWPLLAVLALLGVSVSGRSVDPARRAALGMACATGLAVSAVTALFYTHLFRTYESTAFAEWSAAECTARAEAKGLQAERIAWVCRDPLIEKDG